MRGTDRQVAAKGLHTSIQPDSASPNHGHACTHMACTERTQNVNPILLKGLQLAEYCVTAAPLASPYFCHLIWGTTQKCPPPLKTLHLAHIMQYQKCQREVRMGAGQWTAETQLDPHGIGPRFVSQELPDPGRCACTSMTEASWNPGRPWHVDPIRNACLFLSIFLSHFLSLIYSRKKKSLRKLSAVSLF